jgi:4-hydroxy-tetrahydrodipicolinate synthase
MTAGFRGIFTPLVTPIHPDESPDLESMARLVDYQVSSGVHGFWAMGTSGEFAAFDEDERFAAVESVAQATRGRVPIIVNVSQASTRLAIRLAKRMPGLGVDAIAATPPFYFHSAQDELLTHYAAIRAAVDLPLFIYNIPQTVKTQVGQETARRLAEDGIVSGIKDSQNDLEWFRELAEYVRARELSFTLLAGTRHLIDAAVLAGADGAVPSVANVLPTICVRVYEAAAAGDFQAASEAERAVIRHEALARSIRAGSRNAASLGVLKARLQREGIIRYAGLTRPLRVPDPDQIRDLIPFAEPARA